MIVCISTVFQNIFELQELIQEQEEEIQMAIPVCAANLQTPVGDKSVYIEEIQYNIGNIHYIEHAD